MWGKCWEYFNDKLGAGLKGKKGIPRHTKPCEQSSGYIQRTWPACRNFVRGYRDASSIINQTAFKTSVASMHPTNFARSNGFWQATIFVSKVPTAWDALEQVPIGTYQYHQHIPSSSPTWILSFLHNQSMHKTPLSGSFPNSSATRVHHLRSTQTRSQGIHRLV